MNVEENRLNLLVIAVLVKRLGGQVVVTQEEIDAVAYGRLLDTMQPESNGTYSVVLKLDFIGLTSQ